MNPPIILRRVLFSSALVMQGNPSLNPAFMVGPPAVGAGADACRFRKPTAPAALPNDNRTPAGTIQGNALDVRLTVREAGWYPEGETGCGILAFAFAEEGRAPSIPGPLVRVRVGADVRASVRNELATAIRIVGFQDHASGTMDTSLVAPGAVSEFQFRVTVPGTYFYRAIPTPGPSPGSPDPTRQLVGAFIVDPPGHVPNDRVLIITRWRKFVPNPAARSADEPGFPEGQRVLGTINGLSWPYSERLSAAVGDTIRWRVINADVAIHPLHLHGFYFRVTAQGDMARDSVYAPGTGRMAVTEPLAQWRTMTIEWSPDRSGNWLFHCHMVGHMSPRQRLNAILAEGSTIEPAEAALHAADRVRSEHSGHAHEMAGLILGITVHAARGPAASAAPSPEPARRKLRLFLQRKERVFAEAPGYGFVLQSGREPARDSINIPGPQLALTRGMPVEITVVNRASIPLSVHWHGIELESYFDGVAGWSGDARKLAPPIAPNDSFVVRFTPPRSGTFIYHVHDEGGTELASGLYGALIVREAVDDGARDRVFVVSDPGPGRAITTFVNGTTSPDTVELVAGRTYRFRLISIGANAARFVSLRGTSKWRPVARDGWELEHSTTPLDEPERLGPGMTVDYEVTPTTAGVLSLTAVTPLVAGRFGTPTVVPIRVREARADAR